MPCYNYKYRVICIDIQKNESKLIIWSPKMVHKILKKKRLFNCVIKKSTSCN